MIREELHPGERKQSVTDRQTDRHGVFIELLAAAKKMHTENDSMCQIQYNLSPVKAQTFLRVIMKRSSMCRTQLTIIPAHDNH